MSAVTPDLLGARRFLECLADDDNEHLFGCIPFTKRGRVEHIAGTLDDCASQLIAKNAANNGVYFTVNALSGAQRRADQVSRIRALFLDLDGAPLQPVLDSIVPPQVIVESSLGRWHAYWRVKDCSVDRFKPLQQALAAKFGGDGSVCDPPRLMRLPGFIHQKLHADSGRISEPFLSRIVRVNPSPAYDVDELVSALGLGVASNEPRASSEAGCDRFDLARTYYDGERTRALTQFCGRLVRDRLDEAQAHQRLLEWNSENCCPPLEEEKLFSTYASIKQADSRKTASGVAEIDAINERHAVVLWAGKTLVLREGKGGVDFMSVADFGNFNANWPPIQGQVATRYWLKHPRRRQYEQVVFDPSGRGSNDGIYNLWRGFSVTPRPGDCQVYLDHLREVICSGNQAHFDYLIRWMAHAVQLPGELPGVALVLRGGRGSGKGMAVQPFCQLFGNHFAHLTNRESFLGRFNSHLQDKLVIFADEVFWSGDRAHEGTLKTLITERRRQYEAKGRPIIELSNYTRLIMATNDDWAVPAGSDERRFFALDVASHRQGDYAYFERLGRQQEPGALAALLHYLQKVDLAGFNPRTVPKTGALAEQKLLSLSPVDAWWYDCLFNGAVGPCDSDGRLVGLDQPTPINTDSWPSFAPTGVLFDRYAKHAKTSGQRYPGHQSAFVRRLLKLCTLQPERPTVRGARVPGYRFCTLDEARRQFCEMLGQELEWGRF